MPIPDEVVEFLGPYPPGVRDIALAARELVTHAVPEAKETLDRSARLIGYGYGPGYKNCVCTLILSKKGVKLGVARGSSLPDPTRLLQGKGKIHRHVEFRDVADVTKPGLVPLLEAAVAAWKQRTESGA
jgi:hypothetical protein